jgi:hypothetical protein
MHCTLSSVRSRLQRLKTQKWVQAILSGCGSSSETEGENGLELETHSFIVKIWLEETVAEAGAARWRGCITHVGDGVRQYVSGLGEINAFIAGYLKTLGVRVERKGRLWQWLSRS